MIATWWGVIFALGLRGGRPASWGISDVFPPKTVEDPPVQMEVWRCSFFLGSFLRFLRFWVEHFLELGRFLFTWDVRHTCAEGIDPLVPLKPPPPGANP